MTEVREGDVVRIGGRDTMWTGCLLLVTEVKSWGVIGGIFAPSGAEYPLRVSTADIEDIYRKVEAVQ